MTVRKSCLALNPGTYSHISSNPEININNLLKNEKSSDNFIREIIKIKVSKIRKLPWPWSFTFIVFFLVHCVWFLFSFVRLSLFFLNLGFCVGVSAFSKVFLSSWLWSKMGVRLNVAVFRSLSLLRYFILSAPQAKKNRSTRAFSVPLIVSSN